MKWRHKAQPFEPVEYDEMVVGALRALATGTANSGQQATAWAWIQYVCGVGEYADMSFRPGGHDGERVTAFAEGKRFVGLQILKMTHPDVLEAIEREKRNKR